jgi:hypothetical protein
MKRQTASKTPNAAEQSPASRPRPRRVTLIRCLLLSCMILSAADASAATRDSLNLAITRINASQPPQLVDDVLLLSYRPVTATRFVGVRFAHESWKELHAYRVNEKGVFVLEYPWPEGATEIRYRVVMDGLWMTDPANPDVETDAAGNAVSVFRLDRAPQHRLASPVRGDDGAVTFTYAGIPGRRVALVGDFNNWDPFMTMLEESSPGVYTVTLRIPPGPHWYAFYSGGLRIIDRLNGDSGLDPDGRIVSYFSLPS